MLEEVNALEDAGQNLDNIREAKEFYTEAVKIDRNISVNKDTFGRVVGNLYRLSLACEALGEQDEALKNLNKAKDYAKVGGLYKNWLMLVVLLKLSRKYAEFSEIESVGVAKSEMYLREAKWVAKNLFEDDVSAVVQTIKAAGKDLSKQIPPLLKLGEWYLDKAMTTVNGADFGKADALFNAALVRSRSLNHEIDEDQILERIVETYCEFLYAFAKDDGKINKNKIRSEIDFHKQWIARERRIFKERIDEIDRDHTREAEQDYEVHAEKMYEVFRDIQDMYISFVSMLAEECEDSLGKPPCDYTCIALGSVARMEATPFSDLEFAILYSDSNIGEKINYFRVLSYFLHLKVINLGETILPAVAIEQLNDFQSSDPNADWFYDSETPRGISFDGAMPWASKTPLERMATGNKPALELIRTPKQMAELQDEEIAIKEGYHLADIMSRAAFLYGSQLLLDEYNECVAEKLNMKSSASTSDVGVIRGFQQMMNDLGAFHPYYTYLGPYSAVGGLFNTKKQFYRIISLLLADLGLILNIRVPSSWQIILELQNQGIISESEGASIKVCLSIANEMRLKTYFANNGQKELFSPVPKHTTTTEQSTVLPIFRDYDENVVVCLVSITNDMAERCRAFALRFFKDGVIDTRTLQKSTYPSSIAVLKGVLYFRIQNFPKALESFELEPEDSPDYSLCLNAKGIIYIEFGESEKSVKCFENALRVFYQNKKNSNQSASITTNNLALILLHMGKLDKARIVLEDAIKKHDESSYTIDLCALMINLGRTYHERGDRKSAVEIYERVEQMHNKLTNIPDMHVIHLCLYFSMSLTEPDQHERSIKYMERALRLGHKVFGEYSLSVKLAEIYVFAGIAYKRCNLIDEALAFFQRSLKLLQHLFGDNPHSGKVFCLKHLGNFFYGRGQLIKAVESFENALKQQRILFQGKPCITISETLSYLGKALKSSEKLNESLQYFQEAKDIMEMTLGPDYEQPLASDILNNMGAIYKELGDLRKAKECCTKALDVDRKNSETIKTVSRVVSSLFYLGEICENLGEQDKALKHFEEARELLYVASSKDRPALIKILVKLSTKYFEICSIAKSMLCVKEALEIAKSFPQDDSRPPIVLELLQLLKEATQRQ
ncbi:uncharacterized protein LOC114533242 [Dendronephthya gigantea]|uniref:uncharacterized protein LOC114533242 n=1 Tax=Dendronephthya gigantea TaxID=151771 RepID=UPI00106B61D3|nr:uncharacterized protein LOC114533242 [Dendronephthya gigantea]